MWGSFFLLVILGPAGVGSKERGWGEGQTALDLTGCLSLVVVTVSSSHGLSALWVAHVNSSERSAGPAFPEAGGPAPACLVLLGSSCLQATLLGGVLAGWLKPGSFGIVHLIHRKCSHPCCAVGGGVGCSSAGSSLCPANCLQFSGPCSARTDQWIQSKLIPTWREDRQSLLAGIPSLNE